MRDTLPPKQKLEIYRFEKHEIDGCPQVWYLSFPYDIYAISHAKQHKASKCFRDISNAEDGNCFKLILELQDLGNGIKAHKRIDNNERIYFQNSLHE